MRTLVDGYNLMYALGLLGKRMRPEGFRKVRHRFLNDLAEALGPVEAFQTTVVFDASEPPEGLPTESTHKGMTILYAVGDENADERIERLIAKHSAPKGLTVVSSDHRVRQAATRRKAQSLTADQFWTRLEEARARKPAEPQERLSPSPRDLPPSPEESSYWLREFGELDAEPEIRQALSPDPSLLTDAEIAAIEREVAREDEADGQTRRPRDRRERRRE